MKYIIVSFFAIFIYFFGLIQYYDSQEKEFLNNFNAAIQKNDPSFLEQYDTQKYDLRVLQAMPDEIADSYLNLNYEWSVFKDSVGFIKNHQIAAQNEHFSNMIFYISKTGCYNVLFNDSIKKSKIFCVKYRFNDVNVSFIEQIYL